MAVTINGTTGIAVPLGSASAPAETNTTSSTTGIYYPTSTTLGLSTNGTNAVYIDASQNVGIGTTSPSALLHVSNASAKIRIGIDASSQYTDIYRDSATGYTIYNAAQAATFRGHIWQLGGTEAARIDSSGNLLVGRTTNSSGNTARIAVSFVQNGLVFTPTTNDKFPIDFENAAGSTVGYIQTTSSATTFVSVSDYRLKENVAPITTGLATVSALKPVTYDWKIDGSSGEGFIAHELQEHIPLAVIGEKDAVKEDGSIKPQGVDPAKIVVHLVAAIQELSAEVEALKAKVGA
jgi:hypothetical protein